VPVRAEVECSADEQSWQAEVGDFYADRAGRPGVLGFDIKRTILRREANCKGAVDAGTRLLGSVELVFCDTGS